MSFADSFVATLGVLAAISSTIVVCAGIASAVIMVLIIWGGK